MACMHQKTFDIYHPENHVIPDDYLEIDDLIAPSIQVLNRKGYLTEWCCCGHPLILHSYKDDYPQTSIGIQNSLLNSYIVFKEGISLPILPPEFDDELNEGRIAIRKWHHFGNDFTIDDFYNVWRNILETMEQLYKWALNLPDFKSI